MPIYPDLSVDQPSYEEPIHVSRIKGLEANIEESMKSSPAFALMTWASDEYLKHYGGTKAYEDQIAWEKEEKAKNDAIIDQQPAGFLTGASNLFGTIFGTTLDPSNLLAGIGAEKTIGTAASRIMTKEAVQKLPALTKVGMRAALGFSEGAAAASPFAASNVAYLKHLDEPADFSTFAEIAGTAGLLSGGLRSLVGFHPVIDAATDQHATATGIAQLEKGKNLDVSVFIRDAINRAAEEDRPFTPEEINNFTDVLNERASKLDDLIKEKEQTVKDFEAKGFPKETRSAQSLFSSWQDISIKPKDLWTKEDKTFLKTVPQTQEFDRAKVLSRFPAANWDDEDKKFMKDFLDTQEEKMINERLPTQQNKLEMLNKQLKATPEDTELSKRINQLNKTITDSKIRLKEIKGFKREPKKVAIARLSLVNLKKQRDLFNIYKDHTLSNFDLMRQESRPVTASDVKAQVEAFNTWKGDSTTNLEAFKQFEDEAKEAEPDENAALEATQEDIDNLRTEGAFDEDENKMVDEINDAGERESDIAKQLDAFIKCKSD
jgi:hypothetical protein